MSSAFPKGWTVIDGELGTDVQMSSGTELSGGVSVHFPSTATAGAKIASDWMPVDDLAPTGATDISTANYHVAGNFRASRINANDRVRFWVEFANTTKGTVTARDIWDDGAGNGERLSAAASWLTLGLPVAVASGARYVRLCVERSTSLDFDLYFDSHMLRRQTPGFIASDVTNTAFAGTWTTHTTWTVDATYSHQYQNSSGNITLFQPGLYQVHLHAVIEDALSDGDVIACRVAYQVNGGGSSLFLYGSTVGVPVATTADLSVAADGLIEINSRWATGGTLRTPGLLAAQFVQLAGSGLNYTDARFSAVRINDT